MLAGPRWTITFFSALTLLFLTKAMPVRFVSPFSTLMFFSGTLQLWTSFNYSYHPPPRKIQHGKGSSVTAEERCFGSKLDAILVVYSTRLPQTFALNVLFLCRVSSLWIDRIWSISLTCTWAFLSKVEMHQYSAGLSPPMYFSLQRLNLFSNLLIHLTTKVAASHYKTIFSFTPPNFSKIGKSSLVKVDSDVKWLFS